MGLDSLSSQAGSVVEDRIVVAITRGTKRGKCTRPTPFFGMMGYRGGEDEKRKEEATCVDELGAPDWRQGAVIGGRDGVQ